MKGLLLKDIYNLKWLGICFAALAVILLFLFSSNMDRSQFLNTTMMFLALFCLIVPFISMSMDETNHWDRIALTMPVSRRDMVLSKYVLCLLAVLLPGVLSVLCNLLLYGTLEQAALFDPRLLLMPGLIITAIILPLQFKFGVNNARLIFLALFFAWFFIGEPLLERNGYGGIADLLNIGVSMSLPGWCLLIIAIMALSVFLSLKAYAKREF